MKKFCEKIKLYISLPHIWVLFVVAMLALIMCVLSVAYKDENAFLSSVFSNIFTGLLTGVIICLITTIKSVSLYRTECKIRWLEDLHKECLKFISMYRKMLLLKEEEFENDEDYNKYVYDTLCCGNEVSQIISQGRFMKTLPFNTYKYCKKEFSFDAADVMKKNCILRDEILQQDIAKLSKNEVRELFKTIERQIFILNRNILKKVESLKAKQKAINISIG